jgi:hypothetical protein
MDMCTDLQITVFSEGEYWFKFPLTSECHLKEWIIFCSGPQRSASTTDSTGGRLMVQDTRRRSLSQMPEEEDASRRSKSLDGDATIGNSALIARHLVSKVSNLKIKSACENNFGVYSQYFQLWRMSSSGMWRCVDLALTDITKERMASIFRVENSASGELAWAGGCRMSRQSEITSYIRTGTEV